MLPILTAAPTVTLPAIERGQLWRDEVLDITYRTLVKHPSQNGWHVRCLGGDSGNIWYDVMPTECFATELVMAH
jgi:hypothetical protein